MIAKDVLLEKMEIIKCSACGRCCPSDCPNLSNNLCLIHPRQHLADPLFSACELGPVELALYFGINCPLITDELKSLTDLKIKKSGEDPRFYNRQSLDRILNSEVK